MLDFMSHASSSSGNCQTICDGKTSIFLDAGVNINQLKKKGVIVRERHACLVSHEH